MSITLLSLSVDTATVAHEVLVGSQFDYTVAIFGDPQEVMVHVAIDPRLEVVNGVPLLWIGNAPATLHYLLRVRNDAKPGDMLVTNRVNGFVLRDTIRLCCIPAPNAIRRIYLPAVRR